MIQAVIAHLWQSTVFAVAAALLTLAFRNNHANIRFGIWFAASLKFLIPFSFLAVAGNHLSWQPAETGAAPHWSVVMEQIAGATAPQAAPEAAVRAAGAPRLDLLPILTAIWACGILALAMTWLRQLLRIKAIVRAASLLEIAAPIAVLSSPVLPEPGLFGISGPFLLLPEGIAAHLQPGELDAVIAHELCHWRRRDNLWAAIQMIVEALFWFHPMVWWIGARLVAERERACDEDVVRRGIDRRAYSRGIVAVCRLYAERSLLWVPGITGGDLNRRIEAIMSGRIAKRLNPARQMLLIAAGCAALAGPLAAGFAAAPLADAGQLRDAQRALARGDTAMAFSLLKKLAERDDPAAENSLGQMYDQGSGLPRDYAEAANWYRKAALQGYPEAQGNLHEMYRLGHGVPRDRIESGRWGMLPFINGIGAKDKRCDPENLFEYTDTGDEEAMRGAAARGDAEAQANLGSMLAMGKASDRNEAVAWIRAAADQGNAKGQAAFAAVYASGWGVPKNPAEAAKWVRMAAEQGSPRAQCAMAVIYEGGLGVTRDYAEAIRWYRRIVDEAAPPPVPGKIDWARNEVDFAMTRLGLLYENGKGVGRDDAAAVAWFRRAADHNDIGARTLLGIKYAEGRGVPPNFAEAARLLGKPAYMGVTSAQIALGKLYAEGLGLSLDYVRAYTLFSLAARYPASRAGHDTATRAAARIAARMTPRQREEAEQRLLEPRTAAYAGD